MTPKQIRLLLMMAEAIRTCTGINQELRGKIQELAYEVDIENFTALTQND